MTNSPPTWAITETIAGDTQPDPAAFAGRPLLLLFFNLSCAGCTGRALPYTLELQERYPDLQVAGTFQLLPQQHLLDCSGEGCPRLFRHHLPRLHG